MKEYLNDRRISRAYEACLATVGEKIIQANKTATSATSNEAKFESIKSLLEKLGNYLVENFQTIIETENGNWIVKFMYLETLQFKL